MIDLSSRSYEKELMDSDNIPFEDMALTLKELNIINTRLGGHAITIDGVRRFAKTGSSLIVCEIGCGGGDNLYAIYKYCKKNGIEARFIGIDMNAECINFARQTYPQLSCEWICSDYLQAQLSEQPDIIFSSLFCHHFTDEQMVIMLRWLQQNSGQGFFINDLHRHWLAYYLIKYITRFFSRSYLVKNDAALSVSRGFKKADLQVLLRKAGIDRYTLDWRWAFRWLLAVDHNK
jgi:2-polyprenyl-3-methyl-5-hydroxy-6-metoxy-1,4-benzoquinol methylase